MTVVDNPAGDDFIARWNDFYEGLDDIAVTLELYPISGTSEEVVVGMPLRPAIAQPAGMFSAPSMFGLADVAGTWLAMLNTPEGVFPLAVQSSLNVVSNTKEGHAIATATLVRAGRTLIVTDTKVCDELGKLLTNVVTTYVVPAR
ncbi:hypothetical protein BSZ39_11380 [Bowdeniella nasicola]|uniref:Thioesterase domain-containing protein n=1 Tax=Bowdeniella nasicola TaxID=208480 RepID=A0A1Q5PZN7_9ACTO|nr:PaaI family thioesterase [Bowdeniella nasicola]OKL53084.1 hypothetical protein BSZ39_11380 [Bowdeniella nasicola]